MTSFVVSARNELSLFVALVAVFGVLSLQDDYEDAFELLSRLFWRTASARPPILIVAVLFGWCGVVHAGKSAGLDLDKALGDGVGPPRATARATLALLDVILLCRLVPFVAEVVFETERFGSWCLAFDVVAYGCCFLFLIAPPSAGCRDDPEAYSVAKSAAHVRYDSSCLAQTAASRHSLFKALFESLCAPFAPVTFWHVIVADYATSLAKAMGDVHVTACVAYSSLGALDGHPSNHGVFWEETRGDCVRSEWNAWALALPFWCRLFQCLYVLRKTGEQKNAWNALKYATAFPLVYAGYLDRYSPSEATRRLVVLTAVVQSSATFCWDIFMDWGLFKKRRGALLCGLFEPDAMRAPKSLVFKKKSDLFVYGAYGSLMLFNFCLRFAWALAVFGMASTRGLGMLNFELAEIARRTVWAVFRIEWEYHEKGWALAGDDGDGAEEVELIAKEAPPPMAIGSPERKGGPPV